MRLAIRHRMAYCPSLRNLSGLQCKIVLLCSQGENADIRQIIHYWAGTEKITDVAWIIPLLFALTVIQFFGVRGYGEVEFVLSIMKITACLGFMVLGIIIDCGGVPTDNRGYIGARYWYVERAT
jgi:amino acid permease